MNWYQSKDTAERFILSILIKAFRARVKEIDQEMQRKRRLGWKANQPKSKIKQLEKLKPTK